MLFSTHFRKDARLEEKCFLVTLDIHCGARNTDFGQNTNWRWTSAKSLPEKEMPHRFPFFFFFCKCACLLLFHTTALHDVRLSVIHQEQQPVALHPQIPARLLGSFGTSRPRRSHTSSEAHWACYVKTVSWMARSTFSERKRSRSALPVDGQ